MSAYPWSVATASETGRQFFERVAGKWSGSGEIVAGKYKGTKFVCSFAGSTPAGKTGMTLDGDCRVGVFNQQMSATVEHGHAGFRGTFLDGAKGKGLDVVGGAIERETAVFAIHRNALTGAMRAQLSGQDKMNITISVHVDEELVPVIGVALKRVDQGTVSAIAD
ncbi:hypothetical protein [Chelativorans sp. Marseille-P2723]|uniref:hypothetical protein n=1 Tax=Chelativorans sp. Marseille-P2723 TaxID=2709133 RepID=UPI0015700D4C|nr:hypothetical protein [Chelativorans sp. Marseille-P2723]